MSLPTGYERHRHPRVRALAHEQGALDAVLVRIDDRHLTAALERDLEDLGWTAVIASTPLDAVMKLMTHEPRISAVILESPLEYAAPSELLAYLRDEHPAVRRIVLSPDRAPRIELASERIDGVLVTPWHPRDLRIALRPDGVASRRDELGYS